MTQRKSSGSPSGGQESKVQAVREQTSDIGQNVMQAGGKVTQTALGQGKQVAAETGRQARSVLDQASTRMKEEADAQQKRTAERLRALGDELQSMSSRGEPQGVASDLARQASGTVHQAADWLQQREPGAVVEEVRDFARRHPGMFLAGAAVAGLLAGRLTRNLASTGGMASGDGGGGGGGGHTASSPSNTHPAPQPATARTAAHSPEPTGQPGPDLPVGQSVREPDWVTPAHTEAR